MESGTASVVSGFTAAYPVITVAAAVVILGGSLVPVPINAIAFLLGGPVVLGLGPIAIVAPLTTAYPIVAILVRRFWMDERLTFPQKFAIALAMVGAFLATL